jgi:hypothetical protein
MDSSRLLEHGIQYWTSIYNDKDLGREMQDNNLYIKLDRDNIFIIEVFVDDIIFGRDDDRVSKRFSKDL